MIQQHSGSTALDPLPTSIREWYMTHPASLTEINRVVSHYRSAGQGDKITIHLRGERHEWRHKPDVGWVGKRKLNGSSKWTHFHFPGKECR